jgi:hypothetical protein
MKPAISQHERRGPAIAYCAASLLIVSYASIVLAHGVWELSRAHIGTLAVGAGLLVIGMVYGRKSGDRIHLILGCGSALAVLWQGVYLILMKLYG